MKKLIFIFSIIALFAVGLSTKTYGQLVPRAITCLSADHLHPIAGQPYVYSITIPNPPGDKNIIWRVTQDQTFVDNAILVATAEIPGTSDFLALADADYNQYVINNLDMTLTWKSWSYDPTNPVFVLVNVKNADGTCSPNNLKVWKIEPINAFTLDFDNRLENNNGLHTGNDYGDNYGQCIDSLISAEYDVIDDNIVYDFGIDSLYFEIVAANWSGAWKPSFSIVGDSTKQDIVKVVWDSTLLFTNNLPCTYTPALGDSVWVADGLVIPDGDDPLASVGADGESIYLKIVIAHNNLQGIVDQTFKIRVDGQLYYIEDPTADPLVYVPAGVYDVHFANGANPTPPPPCNPLVEDGFDNDLALQTLLARPNVQPGVGIGNFLPIAP